MNEENITKRSLKDWKVGKTDFSKLDAMTDEQNLANSLADENSLPASYASYNIANGFVTEQDIRLDQDIYYWIQNRGFNPQQYVNNILHQQMQQPENRP